MHNIEEYLHSQEIEADLIQEVAAFRNQYSVAPEVQERIAAPSLPFTERHAGNGPVCHLAGREPAAVWRQSDRKKCAVRNPIVGVRQAILRYFVPRQYR